MASIGEWIGIEKWSSCFQLLFSNDGNPSFFLGQFSSSTSKPALQLHLEVNWWPMQGPYYTCNMFPMTGMRWPLHFGLSQLLMVFKGNPIPSTLEPSKGHEAAVTSCLMQVAGEIKQNIAWPQGEGNSPCIWLTPCLWLLIYDWGNFQIIKSKVLKLSLTSVTKVSSWLIIITLTFQPFTFF